MQLPPELRECVCFIQAERAGDPWVASAFFVGVFEDVQGTPAVSVYVVTARHNIEPDDEAEYGPAEKIGLRLNTRDGASDIVWTHPSQWWKHKTADVAVAPIMPPPDVFDYKVFPAAGFATSAVLSELELEPGEELLITGLLVHHPGVTRIMPIVRVGNLAALPTDPIYVEAGPEIHPDVVALAEVHSIGGLSGCPVFVHPGDVRTGHGSVSVGTSGVQGGPNYLLGVVHGFFTATEDDPDGIIPRAEDEEINTGISIVVLADRIMDLIDSEEARELREKSKAKAMRKHMPRAAKAKASQATTNPEFERFEDTLSKLAQVPKSEVDELRKQDEEKNG